MKHRRTTTGLQRTKLLATRTKPLLPAWDEACHAPCLAPRLAPRLPTPRALLRVLAPSLAVQGDKNDKESTGLGLFAVGYCCWLLLFAPGLPARASLTSSLRFCAAGLTLMG